MIHNRSRSQPFLQSVETARSFWHRLVGVIGRSEIPVGHGLLIPHCRAIHTWFVRFPVDVIFLDRNMVVLEILPRLQPWRLAISRRKAFAVLETRAGATEGGACSPGDRIAIDL